VIITIDGPAGSGKSTAAQKLAARLGIPYLDTGAMYRVVTLAALEDGIDMNDEQRLAALAAGDAYRLDLGPSHIRVWLHGRDVTEEIRSMRVNENTRHVAPLPTVRQALVAKQREIGCRLGSVVTEGRDQGSVAFPDADVKFFLDASPETRAQRRLQELQAEGQTVSFEQVLANLSTRDRTDSQRATGPLTVPAGAIRIDTSHLTIPQMLELMLDYVRRAGFPAGGGQGTQTARGSG
jgi:CMP/dCMP kinase